MSDKNNFETENPPRAGLDLLDWIQGIQNHFGRFVFDIGGVLLFAFAFMTLLALMGWTDGSILTPWALTLWRWLGYGSPLVGIAALVGGLWLMRRPIHGERKIFWGRVVALEAAIASLLTLMAIFGGTSIDRAEAGTDGGYIGWSLALVFGRLIPNNVLLGLFVFLCFLVFVVLGFNFLPVIENFLWKMAGDQPHHPPAQTQADELASLQPLVESPSPTTTSVASSKKAAAPLPVEFRKNFKIAPEPEEKPSEPLPRSESLPPFSMLIGDQTSRPDENHINMTAGLI